MKASDLRKIADENKVIYNDEFKKILSILKREAEKGKYQFICMPNFISTEDIVMLKTLEFGVELIKDHFIISW
jgi:hypothetical protein